MKYYWIILLLLLISCSNEKQSNKAQSSGSLLLGFEAYPHAFMSLPITIKGADLISPSGESHPILINERNINLADFQGFITAAAIPEGEYGTLRLLISLAETHNLTYNATEKAWIQTLLLNHEFKAIPSQQSTYEVTITPKAPIQIRANQAHLYSLNFLSNQLFSTALTDTHANYIQFHPAVELRPADKITLKGSIEFFGQQRVVINSTYLSVEANIDTIDVDGSSYSMTENRFDEIGFLNTSAVTATLLQSNTTQDLYANLSLSKGEQFNGYLIDEGNELKIAYPTVGDDAYPVLSKMAISWGNNLVINADKLHFTDDLSLLPGQQVQLFKSQGQETLKLLETNLLAKVVSAGNPLLVTPLFVNGMNAAGFSTEEIYLRGSEPLPYKEGDLINTSGYFLKNDQSDFFALKHYALTNTQIEININFRPFSSVAMMYQDNGTPTLFLLNVLSPITKG